MPGMFDPSAGMDPLTMLLMGGAAGLGQAGATSRMPISAGSVFGGLGAGLMAGQQAANQSQLQQQQAQGEAIKNAMALNNLNFEGAYMGQPHVSRKDIQSGKFEGFDWPAAIQNMGQPGGGIQMPMPTGSPASIQQPAAAGGRRASGDPLAVIRNFESNNDYNAGYSGGDLSKYPLNASGFPDWPGEKGPQGITHAAGAYQFEPATWKQYADPLGIKDFSKESQDKVAQAAYNDQGFAPWAPFNPRLAKAIGWQDATHKSAMFPEAGAPQQLAQNIAPGTASDASGAPAPQPAEAAGGASPTPQQMFFQAKMRQMMGYQLTPVDQAAMALAQSPPQLRQFYLNQLNKASGIEPLQTTRPGGAGFGLDAQGNWKLQFQNPRLPEGTSLGVGPNGQTTAEPVPGALPGIAAAAGAQAGGAKAATQPIEQQNESFKAKTEAALAGNKPITLTPGETTNVNPNRVPFPTPMGGASSPAPTPGPGAAAPPVGGAPPDAGGVTLQGTPLNVAEEQKATGTKVADLRQQNIAEGNAARMQQATLLSMKNDAPHIYQGPESGKVFALQSYLRLIGMADPESVASFEDLTKNAGTLTRQAVKDTSPRAAVQEFKLINGALPNPDLSPKGFQRVTNEYMGLNDFRTAKVQAQEAWAQAHNNSVAGFEADWQAKASPWAFIAMRMDPDDLTAWTTSVAAQKGGATELALLKRQMQYIHDTGLEQFR